MIEKPIDWRGSSLKDIKSDDIFTPDARREAGRQLSQVQAGLDPDDWKPFDVVGAGTKEIRISLNDLRHYVEGMGGTLQLVAQFPNRPPVVIEHLGADNHG